MNVFFIRHCLFYVFFVGFVIFSIGLKAAETPTPIRLSVLKFGTVNWVLQTMLSEKLDQKYGISIKIAPLANTSASKIALQSKAADIIVTDWTFVAKRRAKGADFTLVPYSSSAGALMVPPNSTIKELQDLKGKTIAVAGGPHDKSWLFIRSIVKERAGFDLNEAATIQYGAPPLLWQKALRGEFDAILNFWHYSARLEAEGFRSLLTVKEAMKALGAKDQTAVVGFTFSDKWAWENPKALSGFLSALNDALILLDKDDKAFDNIRPLMKAKDDKIYLTLRKYFRAGLIRRPLTMELSDIQTLYKVMIEKGGAALNLPGTELPKGVIWTKGPMIEPAMKKAK